jgi:hypothetical protein
MNVRHETRREANKREAAEEEAAERKREDREASARAKTVALDKEATAIDSEPQAELYPGQFLPHSANEPPGSKLAQQEPQAKPVITALQPASCAIGGADFTLFISGESFSDKSVIHFAGFDEPTTLNADGTLSTGVKPSLWGAPAVVQCGVRNGAQSSDTVPFEFTAPADIGARG